MKNFIGILILSTGIVFLLANTGLIDTGITDLFSTFWPAIIIIIGLKIFLNGILYFFHGLRRDRWHIGKILWGIIVTSAGSVLLGNNAGWFHYGLGDLWSWTWPLLIVYIGFKVLFDRDGNVVIDFSREDKDHINKKKKNKSKYVHMNKGKEFFNTFSPEGEGDRTGKKQWNLIGDVSLGRHPWEPDGMDLNMGVGSIELDLTKAVLKEGDNVINVSSWVGSVEIFVPKDMAVQASAFVKLGDVTLFDDSHAGTGRHATYMSPGFYDADKRLILNVELNIGDVEVLTVD